MAFQVTAVMLGVRDLTRSKKFYGEGPGGTIDKDYPGGRGHRQRRAAGGAVAKEAADAQSGGYSGYFSDPDGYLWKVATPA